MRIEKRGIEMAMSWEALIPPPDTPPRPGRYRKLTNEERQEWEKAHAALKELERNKYVSWGYEGPELEEPREWIYLDEEDLK